MVFLFINFSLLSYIEVIRFDISVELLAKLKHMFCFFQYLFSVQLERKLQFPENDWSNRVLIMLSD